MNNWFSIEKIDEATYSISEYGHYEKMHSYLLIGKDKAALIDTGLGIGDIREEVRKLTSFPVVVITTHAHWDHIGGHALFEDILIHEADEDWLVNGLPLPISIIKSNVIKEPFTRELPKAFNIENYKVYRGRPSMSLKDMDTIDIGSRKITVLHTPGHSPGHICLWEEDRGYLYSGDLIYEGTLYANYPSTSPVDFKASIDRISKLENIKRILPAHNSLNIDIKIIEEMKKAFASIEEDGLLKHGGGTFEFDNFAIRL
ncbi:metallo-beta-lactamase domain protein [Clostridiales bacterium oral taxon 876 str. F0540]|nr:metallo-beta-lactamase domain protein [Clostridiales bacterium oral taxon 876 str. F0540]